MCCFRDTLEDPCGQRCLLLRVGDRRNLVIPGILLTLRDRGFARCRKTLVAEVAKGLVRSWPYVMAGKNLPLVEKVWASSA